MLSLSFFLLVLFKKKMSFMNQTKPHYPPKMLSCQALDFHWKWHITGRMHDFLFSYAEPQGVANHSFCPDFPEDMRKKKLVLQEVSKYPSLLLKGSEKTEIAVEAVHSPSSRTSRCTTLAVLPIPAGWHGHWPCPSHKKRSGRHDEQKDESAVLVKSYMQIIWLFYHCLFSIHETENPADFTNAGIME